MNNQKLSPFEIVNLIYSKERELTLEEIEINYNAYIINRALSFNLDTVFFANELNQHWQLSKKMQFDFLYYGVTKKKRYGKWLKKESDLDEEKIDLVKKYFDYSNTRAREVIPILDKLNVWDEIRNTFKTGGLKNNK